MLTVKYDMLKATWGGTDHFYYYYIIIVVSLAPKHNKNDFQLDVTIITC